VAKPLWTILFMMLSIGIIRGEKSAVASDILQQAESF
jgi:hypothetical protein